MKPWTAHPSCTLAPSLRQQYKLDFMPEKVLPFMQAQCESFGGELPQSEKEALLNTRFMISGTILGAVARAEIEDRGLKTRHVSTQRFRDEDGESFVVSHFIQSPSAIMEWKPLKHKVALGFSQIENNNTLFHSAFRHGTAALMYDQMHPEYFQSRKIAMHGAAKWTIFGILGGAVMAPFLHGNSALTVGGTIAACGVAGESLVLTRLELERMEEIVKNAKEHADDLPSWPFRLEEKHRFRPY